MTNKRPGLSPVEVATAPVAVPAVSMPMADSLKTCTICATVFCDRTARFRMIFYCDRHKTHLCNDHASRNATPFRWIRRSAH